MPINPEPIVLVVTAVADRPDADGQWYAQVTDAASPFVDLFAWGPSVSAAREGLARTIWAALINEAEGFAYAGLVAERIHAVRVLITTRKTFSAANLARGLLAEAS